MEILAPTKSRTHVTRFFTSCEAHFKVCCDIHKRRKATETAEQLLSNVTDQKGEIGEGGRHKALPSPRVKNTSLPSSTLIMTYSL